MGGGTLAKIDTFDKADILGRLIVCKRGVSDHCTNSLLNRIT